jgi:hypothetical protein
MGIKNSYFSVDSKNVTTEITILPPDAAVILKK